MVWVSQVPFEHIGMTEDKMSLLAELAEDSDYWKRAHVFVKLTANRVLSSLSHKQRSWLTTIILDLDNELHKKSWRI
ncbi:hypothetical protein ES703_113754 [subsurface metagenome]